MQVVVLHRFFDQRGRERGNGLLNGWHVALQDSIAHSGRGRGKAVLGQALIMITSAARNGEHLKAGVQLDVRLAVADSQCGIGQCEDIGGDAEDFRESKPLCERER